MRHTSFSLFLFSLNIIGYLFLILLGFKLVNLIALILIPRFAINGVGIVDILLLLLSLSFVFLLILYPIVVFILMIQKDKSTSIVYNEGTGEIQYFNNKENLSFNIEDVVLIKTFRLIPNTGTHYTRIFLSSSEKIDITFLVPINKIFPKKKIKRKYDEDYWMKEFRSNR